jgi:hypothetical protein
MSMSNRVKMLRVSNSMVVGRLCVRVPGVRVRVGRLRVRVPGIRVRVGRLRVRVPSVRVRVGRLRVRVPGIRVHVGRRFTNHKQVRFFPSPIANSPSRQSSTPGR